MSRLSVVLVTRNEEHNLDRCLGSVRWADEVVVVDSFSTDGTVAKAREYTDLVFQHEYPGYSRQVERAVGYAAGEWILILDADEEVTPALAAEIREVAGRWTGAPDEPAGYRVPRRVWAFGRVIGHGGWAPDRQFRLFRRDRGRPHHQEVHGAYTCDGPIGDLDGILEHYTYDHVYAYVARMNDYSSLDVVNKLARDPEARAGWTNLLFNPLSAFLRMYVAKAGWRDGAAGFWLALLTAMNSQLTYMKLWEHRRRVHETGDRRPPLRAAEVTRAKLRS